MKKIHNANSCGDEIFASCMCFSTFWKKCKNAFLLLLFLKQALWTWKYVQKKLVIGPDFHQKFYQNRVISQKYTMLQKVYIFNSTSRYASGPGIPPKPSIFGRRRRFFLQYEAKIVTAVRFCVTKPLASEIFWQHCQTCT